MTSPYAAHLTHSASSHRSLISVCCYVCACQSRTHHETGLRHKGNYERYIRDIYKKGERDNRDKAQEAKEIARIDAVRSLPTPSSPMCSEAGYCR